MISILRIVEDTTVDGPGFRPSIYAAGCPNQCPGCHNPESWDLYNGTWMSTEEILAPILADDFADVTFSGGDPMYQAEAFTELARRIRDELHRTIWCYTGFTFEQVLADPVMNRMLPYLEVLVDGPFVVAQRSLDLLFRGSSNQRLIDVQRSLRENKVVEYEYNPYPTF